MSQCGSIIVMCWGLLYKQGLEGLLQQADQEESREGRFDGLSALHGAPSAPSESGRHGKPLGTAGNWIHMARAPTA